MTRQEAEAVDFEVGIRQPTLLDADSMVESVINQAVAYCAQKMGLSSGRAVREQLQKENVAVCKYCHYSIARQVGDLLGRLDQNVEAAYVLDYDATPQDLCYTGEGQATLIHLIVRVKRKTNALNSVMEVLDHALVSAYSKLVNRPHLQHLVDMQVVDGDEVARRIGYGAMLSSLHNRPIQVWERSS